MHVIINAVESNPIDAIPPESGTYVLELVLTQPKTVQPGLHTAAYRLERGHYLYFGSAFGSGGLRARLSRHIKGNSRARHWHIDALRAAALPAAFAFLQHNTRYASMPLECRWAQAVGALPHAVVPIRGFGASDCRSGCPAHLIMFSSDVLQNAGNSSVLLNETILRTLAFQAITDISEVKLSKIDPKREF